ncbi:hypothetical protein AAVH_33097 [Aphelenchoides avenae]|nr:hypothetical protein AAVH_33097 [Aphelenchus avenae]
MAELKEDQDRFKQYTRMSVEAFDKLVNIIEYRLEKRSPREALSPEERLVVCLRFLSAGDPFHSLAINFRIGVSTACNVCHEVCKVLVEELAPTYLRTPSTTDEWLEIADGFLGKWQLPNALGAIDGKHVTIKAPANSGSLYFNYKQHFSMVLIVVADHRSRIVYAHFGSYGRESDAGIFG